MNDDRQGRGRKRSDKIWGSRKYRKFIDHMNDYYLFKNDSDLLIDPRAIRLPSYGLNSTAILFLSDFVVGSCVHKLKAKDFLDPEFLSSDVLRSHARSDQRLSTINYYNSHTLLKAQDDKES